MSTELQERLTQKNREDTRGGWMRIALGLPLAIGGILMLAAALFFLMVLLPMGIAWVAKFWLATGVVLAAVLIDVWRHPSEQGYRARYYLTDGTLTDAEAFGISSVAADGLFAGMPLMTSISDPINLATRGRAISSGFSNVVLSGPRYVRQGIETLALVRKRSRASTLEAASAVLSWLQESGPVEEAEAASTLARTPVWKPGFLLLGELGMLAYKKSEGRRTVGIRSRPGPVGAG